jgi:hypothetical protein
LAEFGLLAGDVGLLTQEELVGLLTVAAPERLPFDLAAAGLKAAERLIGWAGSLKARLIDSLSRGTEDPAHPNFVPDPALARTQTVSEVACALTVTEPAAAALVDRSAELVRRFPATRKALETGRISWPRPCPASRPNWRRWLRD